MFGVRELDMHVRSQRYCSGMLLAGSMRCAIFPFGRMIALSNSWLPGIRFEELITVLFLSLLWPRLKIVDSNSMSWGRSRYVQWRCRSVRVSVRQAASGGHYGPVSQSENWLKSKITEAQ
jgi:hypothetical protein